MLCLLTDAGVGKRNPAFTIPTAVFALSAKRLRHLPMSPARVRDALKT